MISLLILGYLAMVALEVPVMAVRGQKGELRVFWVLTLLGFAFSLAVAWNWPAPNPTPVLHALFEPFGLLLGLE